MGMQNDELIAIINRMLGRGAPIVLDDRGFNKVDYPFARDIAEKYNGRLSFKQRRAVAKMLSRYPRQLAEMGIDREAILAVAREEEPTVEEILKVDTTFTRVGDRIAIDFGGYKPEELQKIRQIPGRQWNPDTKIWTIPVTSLQEGAKYFPGLAKMAQAEVNRRVNAQRRLTRAEEKWVEIISNNYPHLYKYQQTGVAWLMARKGAILGDDMGLGKTKQAIIAAKEVSGNKPVLVVCPAGLKGNWALEITEESNEPLLIIDNNTKPLRKRNPKTGRMHEFTRGPLFVDNLPKWAIVNYDVLKNHRELLLTVKWDVLIMDEAHYIKNNSGRSVQVLGRRANKNKKLEAIVGLATAAERIWLLTGTPIKNKPRDLFNLLKAIRHELGKNWGRFAYRYCAGHNNGWGLVADGASNLEELAENIADAFLQRKKEDELDLPEKTRIFQDSEFDKEAFAHINEVFMDDLGFADFTRAMHELAMAKIEATIAHAEEIVETGNKVIIFSRFTGPIDAFMNHFGAKAVRIDGRDNQEARATAEFEFQTNPNVMVFVGQLEAAGVGLNLTAATYVIFNDYDWVPANHAQAEDRAYRIGQKNAVTVTYIHATDTLDDDLQDVILGKAAVIGRVEQWAAEKIRQRRERMAA